MSHVDYKKWNVALLNLRKAPVTLSILRKAPVALSNLRKAPVACQLSLRPKKGHVALSILGVHTPQIVFKCPMFRIPGSGTVVHKYVLSNCLISLLFRNISMFSGVKLIASLISNEYQA